MTKNIAVIDEQGNRYEATYLKRAKGLVKSGRARFVDEKTICLARPPDKSEDKIMSENMGSKNYSSEDLNTEKADLEGVSADAINSTEDLKKRALAYLDTVQPKLGEGQEKTGEGQEKSGEAQESPGEGQEKQFQGKTLSREIVEQLLDQLDHFAADDAYIAKLAEKHVDSEDMTNIVGLREATRQRQLEVYKTVLSKALDNEAHARTNTIMQLEQVTDWLSGLDRDDFDEDIWKMIKDKAFELMDSIRTVAVTDTIR